MIPISPHCRLTSLVFREECIVTACQDGYVCTWARPGRGSVSQGPQVTALGGPPPAPPGELVSPTQSNQVREICQLFRCNILTAILPSTYTLHP